MITALLVLHALAALAGLVVPRILGSLVDQASAGGTLAATLNGLALAVAGVVVLQAILTFFALWMSTLFGQDLLVGGPRVRGADRARAAAGQGREREHRRPGHAGDPRRQHDEHERPLRPARVGDRRA